MNPGKNHSQPCNLFIGTSGYSYGEWVDAGFYPSGTHSSSMLEFYTQKFLATELNYTWYQMPKASGVERMCKKTPPNFKFAAKLTRTLTHEVKPDQWIKEAGLYRQGIAPLADADKLLTILIQLPPSFNRSPFNRQYLAALLDELSGLPLAVEFRHNSWAVEQVFLELEKRNVTLVTVDCPDIPGLFPSLDRTTNPDLFYIRFHGRNARGWRSGNMQKQFDYNYSKQELNEWAHRIQTHIMPSAREGCIFFNNHVRGQAPLNAAALINLLA